MFEKVLIANRGEIACRIARTCRKHNVLTVGVYSSADRGAMHTTAVDEAVRIGAAPSSESYLNIGAVIDAALQTGAQAVHPGYGFLSENSLFAEACENSGLVFIGPSAKAIRQMGSKAEAKCIMADAGVPVLPGRFKSGQDDQSLAESAKAAGYPVMVKPLAGGGGRGMRIVSAPEGLTKALASARREASLSFGDKSLLVEKLIEGPRHIEVQIFADTHGNIVHLFERDCSIQRRHQKVVEEAPAPNLEEETRSRLYAAALTAAKAVGYVGAGTVEFLLAPDGRFWFMEMNTRLQVEHPVTEQITGIDLVEWQLRVAAGEALPLRQEEITSTGHSIEVRLYAEDPANGFAPGFGRIPYLAVPRETDIVRIDTGVRRGDEVTVHYDPMIAKIIVTESERGEACTAMANALSAVRVAGPTTNEKFLRAIISHGEFREGGVDTEFIPRNLDDLTLVDEAPPSEFIVLAALSELSRTSEGEDDQSPWKRSSGWRLGSPLNKKVTIMESGSPQTFVLSFDGLTKNGRTIDANGRWISETCFEAMIDGQKYRADVVKHESVINIFSGEMFVTLSIDDPLAYVSGKGGVEGSLFSDMPGIVVAVFVEGGEKVTAGQPLIAIEAMKVEHTIRAPADGTVLSVNYTEGDQVSEGEELVSFTPD
ncbi:MAG: Acetyl-/propionyl-coenzyme A carboxylase alpha chain [Alphaproteobacteria bacterium MarineAlpha11_Bin1]|nr:MAG: Acetyl-/propionyl-coenzyme A carboxylase alpha chain [Alphaproteobacteria bacterium MarineAlpha11_Bin1]|tara:strand:- start:236 stop:2197 length:1962 start_codon:yes stop_codon:yes gene_type:complete